MTSCRSCSDEGRSGCHLPELAEADGARYCAKENRGMIAMGAVEGLEVATRYGGGNCHKTLGSGS